MSYRLLPQRGQLFVAVVAIAGTAVIAHSITDVWRESLGPRWLILAVLTLLSGSATVKLPFSPRHDFNLRDLRIYFGAPVRTLGWNNDCCAGWPDNLLLVRKAAKGTLSHRVQHGCACSFDLDCRSSVFLVPRGKTAHIEPYWNQPDSLSAVGIYISSFVINSLLIAIAVGFETGRKVWDIWRRDFLWLSLNYFGGASVSALLVVYTRDIDPAYLSVIVPSC